MININEKILLPMFVYRAIDLLIIFSISIDLIQTYYLYKQFYIVQIQISSIYHQISSIYLFALCINRYRVMICPL